VKEGDDVRIFKLFRGRPFVRRFGGDAGDFGDDFCPSFAPYGVVVKTDAVMPSVFFRRTENDVERVLLFLVADWLHGGEHGLDFFFRTGSWHFNSLHGCWAGPWLGNVHNGRDRRGGGGQRILCRCNGKCGGEYCEGNEFFHDLDAVNEVMKSLVNLLFSIGEIDPVQVDNATLLDFF